MCHGFIIILFQHWHIFSYKKKLPISLKMCLDGHIDENN